MHFVTKVIDHILYTKKICNTFNQIKAQISTIKTFITPVLYHIFKHKTANTFFSQ